MPSNAARHPTILPVGKSAFEKTLVPDLSVTQFADMFAQTLAYGLFSARVMCDTKEFNRHSAQQLIPKTNPFLRNFFYEITGIRLDNEPYAGFVKDLVKLLRHTDMHAVLEHFGSRTRSEDPVVHFYETFSGGIRPKAT